MRRGRLSNSGHCDGSALVMKLSALGANTTRSNPRTAWWRVLLSALGRTGYGPPTPSSKSIAPLLDRNLAGDDRRNTLMTVFEDFEEIALLGLGERRQAPIVQDQELDARETFEQASVAAGERQRLEQARNPMVDHASAVPAALLAEGAGDPTLADAGGPGDQKSFGAVDPIARDEPLEQGAVDAARGLQVDVLD